jgi:hypothetical protein
MIKPFQNLFAAPLFILGWKIAFGSSALTFTAPLQSRPSCSQWTDRKICTVQDRLYKRGRPTASLFDFLFSQQKTSATSLTLDWSIPEQHGWQ